MKHWKIINLIKLMKIVGFCNAFRYCVLRDDSWCD